MSMHPMQRQELRRAIRNYIYYLEQFDEPKGQWADKIEEKIDIQIPPGITDTEYLAFKSELRELIEKMVADRQQ